MSYIHINDPSYNANKISNKNLFKSRQKYSRMQINWLVIEK